MTRIMLLIALGWPAIDIATAQSLELVEGAAELELSDITFPTNAFGSVSFTSCETCSRRTMRVDSNTVYVGSTGPVTMTEFLDEVDGLRATPEGRDTVVGVFYSLGDHRVTRIEMNPGAE